MKMFNEEQEKQLKEIFAAMKRDVTIALFTEPGCYTCPETDGLLDEIAGLTERIQLVRYDLKKDAAKAAEYKVTLAPSFVLLDDKGTYRGVKFNGIPAGHEINSFIPALIEMSGAESEVPKEFADRVAKIDQPVNIKVFVTLSCPHCPGAVQKAHKLAMMNPYIEGEMVEASTFESLSKLYNVSAVPQIVVNGPHGTKTLLGNQPIQAILDAIDAA
jgi:glutaredoxin-like protein